MNSIYEPRGKAREYCERAVNLYKGCGHGCSYCYAPAVMHLSREAFAVAQPREGILAALSREAPKHAGKEVLMCFTCDPYGPGTSEHGLADKAIVILQHAGCQVNVLTKGGERSHSGIRLLRAGIDKYGTTLTFADSKKSVEWEPHAALPCERLDALDAAHHLGIETWASIEPVIDPEESLRIMQFARRCVDTFKIGKWNHDARAKEIDWKNFGQRARAHAQALGVNYVLKKDLEELL